MLSQQSRKIFIAPLNWGLGHATRILPLIRKFLDRGDTVFIAAHDRAKLLLKSEVPECIFIDFPEYPIRYPKTKFFVTRFMLIIFPQMLNAMRIEKQKIEQITRANLRLSKLIFARWSMVVFNFEKQFYQNPDQDLNKLWWNLKKRYQLLNPPEGRNAPDWAS